MNRRAAIATMLAFLPLAVPGCRRAQRCATCGMRIDPDSAWTSYLAVGDGLVAFDTPRCAFEAWHGRYQNAADARFREYYSQVLRSTAELRFVRGSDVVGPMGPDMVPVDPAQASKFARDHRGAPPLTAEQIRQGGWP